jgi:predicted RND superfamily exporter protein
MEINKNFPGTDELYVIAEGEGYQTAKKPEFLRALNSFQRHMEKSPLVAVTLSISDLLPPMQKALIAGYPKMEILPKDDRECASLFYLLEGGSAPGDFDRYFSPDLDMANVIIWYKDHMGDTMRTAIATVKDFIEKNQDRLSEAKVEFKLASGNLGVLAAVNEVVAEAQLLNFVLVMVVIFILCSLTYRSIAAALILMIPLNITNLVTLTVMKALGIGLNINTIPIVSVGVGVGIDYGIYLLSRLCEEYGSVGDYSFKTPDVAIRTTGKAIFFTATTMIAGVIFWYFFSSLRFQAEMGLLLAVIMFVNMIGALLLIPSLVYVFKPKFLGKAQLLVRE